MIVSQSSLRPRRVGVYGLRCLIVAFGLAQTAASAGQDDVSDPVSALNTTKSQVQTALGGIPRSGRDCDAKLLESELQVLAEQIDREIHKIRRTSPDDVDRTHDALEETIHRLRERAAVVCNRVWVMQCPPNPRTPGANGAFITLRQKAITDTKILPRSNVYGRAPLTELSLSACRGEFEPVSFVVVGRGDIASLAVRASELKSDSDAMPADILDIKVVKCWYQSAGRRVWEAEYTRAEGKVLLPELLLNDDGLVAVDLDRRTNAIKVIDPGTGVVSRMDITAHNERFRRVHWSQIEDAPALQPVDIRAGHCRQFWITARIPDDARPGAYLGTVTLSADEVPGMTLPLRLVVHPFELSPPLTRNLIFCSNRMGREYMIESGYIKPDGFWPADHFWSRYHTRLAVANMRRHGIDGPLFVQSAFVKQGIPGDRNREELEHFARMLKEEGYPLNRFYYSGNLSDTQYPGLNVPYRNAWYREGKQWYPKTDGPASVRSADKQLVGLPGIGPKATVYLNYAEEIKQAMLDLKRRASVAGFGQFWFECADELRPGGMMAIYPYLEAFKKSGLKTFTATDPKHFYEDQQRGGVLDESYLEETLRVIDAITLGRELDPRLAARARERGVEVYSYNNPQAGWEVPHTYRRNYGLALWSAGYTGGMNYCYTERYWNDFDGRHRPHCMVYPSADRMIDTLQWEGYREGIDDVRYLTTLLDAIEIARKAPATRPKALDAQRWVRSITIRDTKGWEGFREGVDDTDLDALRRTMVDWILRLTTDG